MLLSSDCVMSFHLGKLTESFFVMFKKRGDCASEIIISYKCTKWLSKQDRDLVWLHEYSFLRTSESFKKLDVL